MKSKNKKTMIACFAIAGVLLLALVLMIIFDNSGTAGEDPIQQLPGETTVATGSTEETFENPDNTEFPGEETTVPVDPEATTQPTEPGGTTNPSDPSDPTNPSNPTKPTNPGSDPAEEEEGDIEIEIDVEEEEPTSGGGSGNGGNSGSGSDDGRGDGDSVIDFDDLMDAAGND